MIRTPHESWPGARREFLLIDLNQESEYSSRQVAQTTLLPDPSPGPVVRRSSPSGEPATSTSKVIASVQTSHTPAIAPNLPADCAIHGFGANLIIGQGFPDSHAMHFKRVPGYALSSSESGGLQVDQRFLPPVHRPTPSWVAGRRSHHMKPLDRSQTPENNAVAGSNANKTERRSHVPDSPVTEQRITR